MFELTGFQRDLLVVASALEKPSGQEIKERIEAAMGTTVKHGRLYPNLDTLVERSLLEKGQHDRRTNYYQITEKGKLTIQERLEWIQSESRVLPA
ncbi:PadR family transcriptional regulator [Halogranum rubrum]|uniref:Transcriptional regulator PadR family protein n=1 Tax=Halogranum salarium B-1 TaxID=1210908 RepID=J3JDT2_9EURY|nr:PadR family transcriptional regulator [Halogranum salarium]EJN57761.1 transcriptional regulator PadR family protein [Halogranum salarium B-1]